MPVQLSKVLSLYQPPNDQEGLEEDLEHHSDPEVYDQDDPILQMRKAEILERLKLFESEMTPAQMLEAEERPTPEEAQELQDDRDRAHARFEHLKAGGGLRRSRPAPPDPTSES